MHIGWSTPGPADRPAPERFRGKFPRGSAPTPGGRRGGGGRRWRRGGEGGGSGGAARLHLREGEREGGADRGVVAEGAATREELRSLRLVEFQVLFQVLGRADRTLDDVGP